MTAEKCLFRQMDEGLALRTFERDIAQKRYEQNCAAGERMMDLYEQGIDWQSDVEYLRLSEAADQLTAIHKALKEVVYK